MSPVVAYVSRMRSLQATLQQQSTVLEQIAHKLNIEETAYMPADYSSIPFADQTSLSVYDNISVTVPQQLQRPERDRYKSIRMAGQERPVSVVI